MNCRRIEQSIPLYVEGDLSTGEAKTVATHLLGCQDCAGVLTDYRASQELLKGYAPPDFSPVFFDELRASVLTEINKQRRRPGFIDMIAARLNWNIALVAATLALLFAATVSYLYLNRAATGPQEQVAINQPGDGGEPVHGAAGTPIEELPVSAPRKIRPRRRANPPRPVRRETAATVAAAEAKTLSNDDEKIRIEIQTSDPNVRIIWFGSKTDEPLSSEPQTEL
ncbi:MAG TPA: zf-HC2 domain-containing protein [Blastocatellia bacterium]|nr:zf-HC2 domain-containing protein [Blastocatellia bacterium]